MEMMMLSDSKMFADTLDSIMVMANQHLNNIMKENNVDKRINDNVISTH